MLTTYSIFTMSFSTPRSISLHPEYPNCCSGALVPLSGGGEVCSADAGVRPQSLFARCRSIRVLRRRSMAAPAGAAGRAGLHVPQPPAPRQSRGCRWVPCSSAPGLTHPLPSKAGNPAPMVWRCWRHGELLSFSLASHFPASYPCCL